MLNLRVHQPIPIQLSINSQLNNLLNHYLHLSSNKIPCLQIKLDNFYRYEIRSLQITITIIVIKNDNYENQLQFHLCKLQLNQYSNLGQKLNPFFRSKTQQ